jgi:hypothetical protein
MSIKKTTMSDIYPSLQELDQMISSLQDLNHPQEEIMVPVSIQKQVMETKPSELFEKSFIQPKVAQSIHAQTMANARNILAQFDKDYHCTTLPPLFVRFKGNEDVVIPVTILHLGELLVNYDTIPDLVMSFSSVTKSILITLCKINPEKMKDYAIVENTLFSMESNNDLTLQEFQRLYDLTRYAVLRRPV